MKREKPYDPLRPIGARALKSAGDTLRPYLADASVLDLYAGQGRFGLMTLEEGAASVVFVEKDKRHAAELKRAVARYETKALVVTADVFAYLAKNAQRFDLVFADPPFPDWSGDFASRLFSAALPHISPPGIFLVKHPSRVLLSDCPSIGKPKNGERSSPAMTSAKIMMAVPSELQNWKSVAFGESTLAYFRYAPEQSTD